MSSKVNGPRGAAPISKTDATESPSELSAPTAVANVTSVHRVEELAALIRSGAVTRAEALESLIAGELSHKLPASLRAKIESTIRESLESDPHLSELVAELLEPR